MHTARIGHGESTKPRLAHVQGLRAVAVLSVVVYHAGLPLPGGFVGVDVFFVISGFVITLALTRDVNKASKVRFARFYGRRVRRLLPALALMVSATLLMSAALQSPFGAQRDTAAAALGASTWSVNVVLYVLTGDYFANAAETIPLLHTWSLSVEEQFYLVFPALVAAALAASRRAKVDWIRRLIVLLSLVGAASFCLSLYLSWGGPLPGVTSPESAAFYSSPTRAWQFVVGSLLALWAMSRSSTGLRPLGWTGLILLIGSFIFISSEDTFPGLAAVAPTAAAAMLILGGQHLKFLRTPALTRLGDLSYSWYLWHWPFIVFAELISPGITSKVAGAVISLAVAWIAYAWVEEPLRLRTPGLRGTSVMVGVCVLVPALLSVGLFTGSRLKWGDEGLQDIAAQVEPVPWSR